MISEKAVKGCMCSVYNHLDIQFPAQVVMHDHVVYKVLGLSK